MLLRTYYTLLLWPLLSLLLPLLRTLLLPSSSASSEDTSGTSSHVDGTEGSLIDLMDKYESYPPVYMKELSQYRNLVEFFPE